MTEYSLKAGKYIFYAKINENPYGYYIRVGGKEFQNCVELNISALKAKLIQIKAEPECGYPQFLQKGGGTVEMVKAALQFANIMTGATRFELDDDSNIECSTISEARTLPRKLAKPFSLAFLSIATYGETWYERQFGAKMLNEENYRRYRESTNKLYEPINITFDDFVRTYFLKDGQIAKIRPHFGKAKTWEELFTSIPKSEQCEVFYNWLPTCVENIIGHTFNDRGWVIDITKYERPRIQIGNTPIITKGSGRLTRKKRRGCVRFSNSMREHGSYIM